MSQNSNVLFIGATGYVGGTVLTKLVDHLGPSHPYIFNAIVRSEDKVRRLNDLKWHNVRAIHGTLDDLEATEQLAASSDIIFSLADSDSLEPINSLLKGAKRRFEKTNVPVLFVHTSGTGAYTGPRDKWGEGTLKQEKYTDLPNGKEGYIHPSDLPPDAFHQNVDSAILKADREGFIQSYIVLPSTIWGPWSGPLVASNIQNPRSKQVPYLIQTAIKRRAAGIAGPGENIWPQISIDDCANFYVVLFDHLVDPNSKLPHGKHGFYNQENGHYQALLVAKEIAKSLHALDPSKHSSEVKAFTKDEIAKENWLEYTATTSRVDSSHSRSLGWQPKGTTEEFYESIDEEVKHWVALTP